MDQRPAKSAMHPSAAAFEADATLASIFELFGILDGEGRVVRLAGSIFDKTNTNPTLLVGQRFAETVFWQSSAHTSKLLERAISGALLGQPSDSLLDFRVSADEKIAMEVSLRPLGSSHILCCAKSIADRHGIDAYKEESEQLLFAAEN